jgi:hypothetical protein
VRSFDAVDRRGVGLFGHSEGGWVALRASADGVAPRFLILNSCPPVSFLDAEVYALTAAGVGFEQARSLYGVCAKQRGPTPDSPRRRG